MNRISGAISCCHLVSSNIVFGRRLRCCGAPLLRSARRLLPSSHCHMAAFQRCTGKPERDGDTQRDMVRPGKLFYIIPRHNRADPNVRVHTLQQGGECVFSRFTFSRDFPAYRFNGEGKKKKKAPAGFRFTVVAFSAVPSNYNNELWRSNATPRRSEKQARRSFCMLHACTRQQHRRTFIQK